ncbi:hypothetical protein NDU88_010269 [Pleurodeles waltl]|uniref:Uncharacterized protein n=1 Tax=Pleurodeles waltl TaxID=8319 RepID=A0AAV7QTY0_PLEWA|nr:hypothetical protein NDU88_010269 [Pleurodeles waltl]
MGEPGTAWEPTRLPPILTGGGLRDRAHKGNCRTKHLREIMAATLNLKLPQSLITHLYRVLRDDLTCAVLPVQTKWQEMVGEPLSPKEWEKVHEDVRRVSPNARFKV